MAEPLNPGCSPVRGKGERDIWCERYGECLDYVIGQDWKGWSCGKGEPANEGCELERKVRKPERKKRKPKRGRVEAMVKAEETREDRVEEEVGTPLAPPEVKMCKVCGEEPAILRGDGKAVHGLGRKCYGDKVRATMAAKRRDGAWVRELREELGVSQEVFARYLGISRCNLSNIEVGRSALSPEVASKMEGHEKSEILAKIKKESSTPEAVEGEKEAPATVVELDGKRWVPVEGEKEALEAMAEAMGAAAGTKAQKEIIGLILEGDNAGEFQGTVGEIYFGEKFSLTIDMDKYPDVVPALERAAHAHIRSRLEDEALAYIILGLKRDGFSSKEEAK